MTAANLLEATLPAAILEIAGTGSLLFCFWNPAMIIANWLLCSIAMSVYAV